MKRKQRFVPDETIIVNGREVTIQPPPKDGSTLRVAGFNGTVKINRVGETCDLMTFGPKGGLVDFMALDRRWYPISH